MEIHTSLGGGGRGMAMRRDKDIVWKYTHACGAVGVGGHWRHIGTLYGNTHMPGVRGRGTALAI